MKHNKFPKIPLPKGWRRVSLFGRHQESRFPGVKSSIRDQIFYTILTIQPPLHDYYSLNYNSIHES